MDELDDLSKLIAVGTIDVSLQSRHKALVTSSQVGQLNKDNAAKVWKPWGQDIEQQCGLDVRASHLGTLQNYNFGRVTYRFIEGSESYCIRARVYLVAFDTFRQVSDKSSKDQVSRRQLVQYFLRSCNSNLESWKGNVSQHLSTLDCDRMSSGQLLGLTAIYNTMPSPRPNSKKLGNACDPSVASLLSECEQDDWNPTGLRTTLFNYQRASVWKMLQRELAPEKVIDFRLKLVTSPTGKQYYMDIMSGEVFAGPIYYEDTAGGILCEEMGTGKTCICLALILHARHQMSRPPPSAYETVLQKAVELNSPTVPNVILCDLDKASRFPSLRTVAARTFITTPLSTRPYRREMPGPLQDLLTHNQPFYLEYPVISNRKARSKSTSRPIRIYLSDTTLVVVPDTLVDQWRSEITKHVQDFALDVLFLPSKKTSTDEDFAVQRLLDCDLVLMSHSRFAAEEAYGRLDMTLGVPRECSCPYIGRTRSRNCKCKSASFQKRLSPLMQIRWKRLIVDEGHSMSNTSRITNLAGLLHVDARWVVSGTPTSHLTGEGIRMRHSDSRIDTQMQSKDVSEYFNSLESSNEPEPDEPAVTSNNADMEDLLRLGHIFMQFLQIQPFSNQRAAWRRDIVSPYCDGHPEGLRRLEAVLHRVLIRNRVEDLEKDVILPEISSRIVRLPFERLGWISYNALLAQIALNVVTSESEHQDYIFHPSNRKHLATVIDNLRHSCFHWTGMPLRDVQQAYDFCTASIERERIEHKGWSIDILQKCSTHLKVALDNKIWQTLATAHELPYYVDELPTALEEFWIDVASTDQPLVYPIMYAKSILNLRRAFTAPDKKPYHEGSEQSLIEEGLAYRLLQERERSRSSCQKTKFAALPVGTPQSILKQQAQSLEVYPADKPLYGTKRKRSVENLITPPASPASVNKQHTIVHQSEDSFSPVIPSTCPQDCFPSPEDLNDNASLQLVHRRIRATGSSKLNYLIDQLLVHAPQEKCLVFCQHANTQYYLAEALDVVGIKYLIYTSAGLNNTRRSQYIVTYNTSERIRVMIMDIKLAGRGLNISSASRVYFVEPVWQPDLEAQAIKRAHRIGQTRPVTVETLVIAGSIEDEILERRSHMSQEDFASTKTLTDDGKMRRLLSSCRFMAWRPCDITLASTVPLIAEVDAVDDPDRDLVPVAAAIPASRSTHVPTTSERYVNQERKRVRFA